ncbi:MAG: aminopeptidase [Proteobacteria bacterium]|nr:aminopeptidase [Pseudomonadota bacterium]
MVRMLTEESAAGARPASAAAARAALLGACAAVLLAGCATSSYVLQAAGGQFAVMHERVAIAEVVADPKTPQEVRRQLEQVQAARDFASRELGLPDNASYRSYADIGRPFVVWNVVAAPEFSVTPEHWCFPVAGCVSYRGYFHEQAAHAFAYQMRTRGLDVFVGGVPAYSTLGKFADPVLSSMLRYGDDGLAATMFHELAHQLLYLKDDSAFNEAFATAVEDAGLERWITYQGGGMRIREYRDDQEREAVAVRMFAATRTQLAALYATHLPAAEMRARKHELLARLVAEIRALEYREKVTYPLYDQWIAQGLNNAQLASVATYYECVPGFQRLLAEEGNDLPRFYTAARELSKLPRAQRHARLCAEPEPGEQGTR